MHIRRWTDDILEDQKLVERECYVYLKDMTGLPDVVEKLA